MRIRFRANARKAQEVLLWLAQRADGMDFHKALKLLFFADVYHLNAYGRPIIGDVYKALPYGPVAQTTYDILKGDPLALEELGEDDALDRVGRYGFQAKRAPNLDVLSESEVEALEWAYETYGGLAFDRLTRLSHEHPAYRRAEEEGRQVMAYDDFITEEADRQEKLHDLADVAAHMVL